MNNDKLIVNTIFPKSNNHKIIWNRKDKITTCGINKNCVEIIFDIKNKFFKYILTNNKIIISSIIQSILLFFKCFL